MELAEKSRSFRNKIEVIIDSIKKKRAYDSIADIGLINKVKLTRENCLRLFKKGTSFFIYNSFEKNLNREHFEDAFFEVGSEVSF